jgi:hypothetical protein
MKLFHSSRSFWHVSAAAATALALAGGASPALAESTYTTPQATAQGATLTLLLSSPKGDPSTLVYTADVGWRLHAGWDTMAQAGQGGGSAQPMPIALKPPMPSSDRKPVLERPLTVFIDGPTGFTYTYASDEGWKFVGQIANASH